MTESPLRVEGFGRRYRRNVPWAVRDLDVLVPRGSITALVGPNGAGKSTLIRSWMGFERPDEGRAFVEGLDVTRNRTEAIRQLAYVPQANSLYRDLTVKDHFTLARTYRPLFDRGVALSRVNEAGIEEGRLVGTLSGGEQAQVALAIALGTGAKTLLLDEPLANLDPLARREFLAALVDYVQASGATALLSSHIVTDIQQACDWLVVLSHGHLQLETSVADARAQHRAVAAESTTETAIGRFIGPDGERLALIKSEDSSTPPATLEEVVLGYMANRRPTSPHPR